MSIRVLLLLLLAGFTAIACDESLSKLAVPTPSLEPTFASVQKEIFETTDAAGRVACVNCHKPARRGAFESEL